MPWTSLKSALLFNALCSTILGVILLFSPSAVAALMGEFNPLILMVLGAGLLLIIIHHTSRPCRTTTASHLLLHLGRHLLLRVLLLR